MPELRTPLDSLVADLRARQLSAWEAGDRVALESLLADHPEVPDDQEALLHLIYAEVLLREEFGERHRNVRSKRCKGGLLARSIRCHGTPYRPWACGPT